jgi:predicted component of type VI protein secretion system
MYGEFCGLSADKNAFTPPAYNHADLYNTFNVLITLLEEKIKFFYKINPYIRSAFKFDDKLEMLTLKLTDEQITKGTDYILSVSAGMSSRDIMNIVEKGTGFKVMSPGTARGKAVLGLKLSGYFDKNFQLPQTGGTCYFQLGYSKENPIWKAIIKEKEMAIVCGKLDREKLNVELFVMLPEKEEIEDGTE